ncbi:hypothetical protein P7C71_g5692, partial [Lecanoromycetidae sp. Uapishka_2]
MPTAFWNSWQLWEKLCFCLGSAIVVVILLGCVRLVYNHWKLRSYIKIATANKAAQKQEMQHSQSVRRGRFADAPGAEVPFGVRAIESGIEVDGVWVSRSNTPANSVAGSPKILAKDFAPDRASALSEISRIEVPQPIHRYSDTDRPTSSPFMSHNALDNAGPSKRKHNPPPTSDHQSRGRVSYEPRRSSQLRFSSYSSSEDPEALVSLEGRSVRSGNNGPRPEGTGSEASSQQHAPSSASSGSGYHDTSSRPSPPEPSANSFLHPSYNNPMKGKKPVSYELSDVSPLEPSHESIVDEKGNLIVRNRHNGMTVGYGPVQDTIFQGPLSPVLSMNNPFDTPEGSPIEGRMPALRLDDDSGFHHAPITDHITDTYDQDRTGKLQQFVGNGQLRRSQVIRKVNSGFEILRPGTLGAPRPSTDNSEWSGNLEEGTKRQSRKLQKKTRPNSYSLEDS